MIHRGALDYPVARSSHTVPTPKGGGVGIVAAYAVGTLWMLYRYTVPPSVLAPLGAALVLAVVSYIDDVRPGPFLAKLGAQIFAAAAVMLAGDTVRDIAIAGQLVQLPRALGIAVSLALIVFVTNAVNFMDGLNGLAGGCVALGGAALAAGAPPPVAAQAGPLVAGISGFLPFNFPRARIFMGDVGSQVCGFMTADLIIRGISLPAVSLILPLAMLPLLCDVAFTLLRRARGGARLTDAHRGHIYQVANRAGIGAAKVAGVYWAMTGWGALCGYVAGRSRSGVAAGFAALLLSLAPMAAWLVLVSSKARKAGITRW